MARCTTLATRTSPIASQMWLCRTRNAVAIAANSSFGEDGSNNVTTSGPNNVAINATLIRQKKKILTNRKRRCHRCLTLRSTAHNVPVPISATVNELEHACGGEATSIVQRCAGP